MSRAKAAGAAWRASPYSQRRRLLKIILKFIVENQEEICRWAGQGWAALGWAGWLRVHMQMGRRVCG